MRANINGNTLTNKIVLVPHFTEVFILTPITVPAVIGVLNYLSRLVNWTTRDSRISTAITI